MNTIKYLIIATALATTLGPVSVYAMDQEQKPEEASEAASAQPMSAEEIRQLQLTAQRTPHIATFLPVVGVANIASGYAAFTPEQVERANRDLWDAIFADNVDDVTQALMGGADVNPLGDASPLCVAIENRDKAELVRILIEARADVNHANQHGLAPLWQAILNGNAEIVRILIEAHADVNIANQHGWTPLRLAIIRGHAEIVRILIAAGADVNRAYQNDMTPLRSAIIRGHAEIVRILIAAGADVNHAYQDGMTPLRSAIMLDNAQLVKMLVFNGATPSGEEPENMKEVIEQAREARRQLGDQNWLPQELVESGQLTRFLGTTALHGLVGNYADPRVGIKDVEIQKLIEEQILKNKKHNAEKRSPAQESTDLPHRKMSVEQAAAQDQEDARAHDVRRPLPQSQPEQLLPSHDGGNVYRPLAFYIDQLSRDERLAQSIKDSVIARLFQAAGDSGQLDVPTANAITISALEAHGINLQAMDMPVDNSLAEERKDAETEEKNNAPEKSQQEQMREARLKRFDRKK